MHSGLMIAAPKSGSGKTLVTCALLAAMKARGLAVRAFKSGPDYIDPMFHSRVLGVPSRNLDTFFSDGAQIRELYEIEKMPYDYSVVEGAMGLYDGLGGVRQEGSAYHLAQTLELPVVLVLDARGMGRTMASVLAGLLQDDGDRRICGVILNRTSESFCRTIAPLLEERLGVPVLGCFPQVPELQMDSRHLGLLLPDEIAGLQGIMTQAARHLEAHVDVTRLLQLAESWALHTSFCGHGGTEEPRGCGAAETPEDASAVPTDGDLQKPVLALAYDRAFCFYYKDNLRLLSQGARLVPFSPLEDTALPPGTDGLLLGGGYPELFARELSENKPMLAAIREALAAGMPSVAECGGFLYLHEALADENGKLWPLVGAVHGTARNSGKLVRFGYVTVQETAQRFLQGSIRGHEFHYYDSDCNGSDCVAQKPAGAASWTCVHAGDAYWWGFPHLYYPSNPQFVRHFCDCLDRYRTKGEPPGCKKEF